MKLFKFICGIDEKVGIFEDEADANERRTEVDTTFFHLPVKIEEIVVPGYEIIIKPIKAESKPASDHVVPLDDQFTGMDAKALKAWLDSNEVAYMRQWGEVKLRGAARAWVASQVVAQQTKEDDIV